MADEPANRALITGGTGYLGLRLAEHLRDRGWSVRLSSRAAAAEPLPWKDIDLVRVADGSRPGHWQAALADTDVVFHLAAPDAASAATDPVPALHCGAVLTLALVQAAAAVQRPPLLIKLSSVHVYGTAAGTIRETTTPLPAHPYALGHLVGETVLRYAHTALGLVTLNVRLANAFGRPVRPPGAQWSLVFNDLCRQAASGGPLVLKTANGPQRNFITLHDTVRALRFLARRPELWPGDATVNLGGPSYWNSNQIAQLICQRCQERWGWAPRIQTTGTSRQAPPTRGVDFDFERLRQMGFAWQDPVTDEIDATLEACKAWRENR